MLPRLTPEQAIHLGRLVKERSEEKGISKQMLGTQMSDAYGMRITEWDMNSLFYRGQGLRQVLLYKFLTDNQLLTEEDLDEVTQAE